MTRLRSATVSLALLGLLLAGCDKLKPGGRAAAPTADDYYRIEYPSKSQESLDASVLDIEVTPAAVAQVTQTAREMGLNRWWLRYRVVPGGCQGFQNKLDLDAGPLTGEDLEVRAGNINLVLLKSQRHLVQGTRIDWTTLDGQTGFTVKSPRATAETQAAVRKWIADEARKMGVTISTEPEPEPETAPPPRPVPTDRPTDPM